MFVLIFTAAFNNWFPHIVKEGQLSCEKLDDYRTITLPNKDLDDDPDNAFVVS